MHNIEFCVVKILGSFFTSHSVIPRCFFFILELKKKTVYMSNNKITDMKTSIIIGVIDATQSSSCKTVEPEKIQA